MAQVHQTINRLNQPSLFNDRQPTWTIKTVIDGRSQERKAPPRDSFWFETPLVRIEAVSPHIFAKKARNSAYIFATIQSPSEFWIPGDDEPKVEADELGAEIPSELRQFADLFDAERAKVVLPHRPSDHAIEMEPGKDPPFGPIYPLLERELKVLKDYLEENEAAGRIRPS